MFLVGIECVDRIRMGTPKAHSRNVNDLPTHGYLSSGSFYVPSQGAQDVRSRAKASVLPASG
jgi:hypothetical protein